MKQVVCALKNVLDFVLLPVFYLIVWYDFIHTKVKECYFIVFRIPYYKIPSKFKYYVVRKNA